MNSDEEAHFERLDLKWASAIATSLRELSSRSAVPAIDEVWVGPDLDLCIRYRIAGTPLAMRFIGLDVEPASGLRAGSALRFASDLYHDLHTDPGADAWRDSDGYRWWGDEPDDGWPSVLTRTRLFTAR